MGSCFITRRGGGGSTQQGFFPSLFVTGLQESDIVKLYQGIRLPDEYQEVEYIESSGTQYIDTLVSSTTKPKIELSASIASETQNVFGCSDGPGYRVIMYADLDRVLCYTDVSAGSTVNGVTVTDKTDITITNTGITVNGISGTNSSSSGNTFSGNLTICRSQTSYATCKLYSCKIVGADETLLRNFIPCYRKSDNEIGLYDTVTDMFLTNQGTGTFAKGADVTWSGKVYDGVWTTRGGAEEVALIPNMTSNNAPIPFIASASSEYAGSGYETAYAYRAFSTAKGSFGWLSATSASAGAYLQLDMGSSYLVTKIKFKISSGGSSSETTTMKVQTSSDGINFVDIESVTRTFSNVVSEEITVTIDDTIRYIRFSGVDRTSGYYGIYDAQLYGYEQVSGHYFSPITDFGTYTLVVTDGTSTSTETILIDAAIEYDLEMRQKLWLYKEGNECVDVTGGWTNRTISDSKATVSSPVFQRNGDNITVSMYVSGGNTGRYDIATVNAIDLTGYTKMYVELLSYDAYYTKYYPDAPQNSCYFINSLSSSGQVIKNGYGLNIDSYNQVGETYTTAKTRHVVELNIIGTTQMGHLTIVCSGTMGSSYQNTATLYNAWLE